MRSDRRLVFEFEPPARMLTLNDRCHWAARARYVKAWRWAAYVAAVSARGRGVWVPQPVVVQVTLPMRQHRRRDPHNYFATVKPIVDGIVDAGVVGDDTAEWVSVPEPVLHVGGREVVVLVTPRGGG